MSKYTTPAERIAELVREHGGPTAAAAACGIHPSTFSRMLAGKEIPGASLIARLGLVAETKYRLALDTENHGA